MRELDGRVLSSHKLECLSEAVEECDHREIESPVVEDSAKVEITRTV